jgi:hypothetical protein
MTSVDTTASLARAPKDTSRRLSRAAGILYLLTFVSIPTLSLYAAVQGPDYLLGSGPDNPATVGAVLELIVALACIGTAVTLFPLVKAQGESLALGFIAARVLEAGTIFTGVATILTLVTLRQSGVGADGLGTAHALVALHGWLNLGQGLMPVINAVLLGTLLFRGRLVPRWMPVLAFVGAPLLLASTLATVFGVWGQMSGLAGLAALPIAAWEFTLGVWLVVKGTRQV